jgi:serine/threonine protein kinase
MAPEILESKTYSWAVDVYSYGILMWEVLTETVPYAELSHPMSILKHVAV